MQPKAEQNDTLKSVSREYLDNLISDFSEKIRAFVPSPSLLEQIKDYEYLFSRGDSQS